MLLDLLNVVFYLNEGFGFIVAMGSILGLFILMAGLLGMLLMPRHKRQEMILVIIIGVVLLVACGLDTGLEYFGIRI